MSKEAMKQALDAFKDLEKNRCLHYPKVVKALEEALKQEQGELVCVCGAVWENGQLICTSKQEQGNTKRPVESDYLSYTAYTRALEAYCDEQEKADTVDGKTFDRFVALNESNAARILELEAQLAKQEQDEPYLNKAYRLADELRNHLSIAPATQEQGEPVAIIHRNEYNEYRLEPHDNFDIKSIPFNVDVSLYTTPQPQEFVCSTGLCRFTLTQTNVGIGERGMEAYEAAKERGWVGVSDERLMEMPKQEPVAFKIYKPTPPRGAIPNVRDAELPWVYDQDPSSGNVASMWVTPVQTLRIKS